MSQVSMLLGFWHLSRILAFIDPSDKAKIKCSFILCMIYRLWRRAQFCPECNRCFGREVKESEKSYWSCWVCSRQHHSYCVGQERFICAACQKRTLDKSIGAGNYLVTNVIGTNHGDYGITGGQF